MTFLHEILVYRRDLDDNVFCPIWHTLTAQSRLQRRHRCLIQLIKLVIGPLVTGLQSLLYDDMTS